MPSVDERLVEQALTDTPASEDMPGTPPSLLLEASGRPIDPKSDAVAELAILFELYPIHYGQSPAPATTRVWVGEMARSARLRLIRQRSS